MIIVCQYSMLHQQIAPLKMHFSSSINIFFEYTTWTRGWGRGIVNLASQSLQTDVIDISENVGVSNFPRGYHTSLGNLVWGYRISGDTKYL